MSLMQDPNRLAMLMAGLKMMESSRGGNPDLTKGGLGYALGQGLQGGVQGYGMGQQFKDKARSDDIKTRQLGLLDGADTTLAKGILSPEVYDKEKNNPYRNIDPVKRELMRGMIDSGDYKGVSDMMASSGGYQGNSMTAQDMNRIMSLDPNSKEYAFAYNGLSQPRTIMTDQGLMTIPSRLPPGLPKPKYQFGQQAGATQKPAIIPGMEKIGVDQSKYNSAYAESAKLIDAYNRYTDLAQEIVPDDPSGWVDVSGADFAKLNSAYKALQISSKGPNLFALGILAGPDMDLIEGSMLDPTSLKGNFLGKDAILSSVGEVGGMLESNIERLNDQFSNGSVKFKDIPKFNKFTIGNKETPPEQTQIIGDKTYIKTQEGWVEQ